MEGIYHEDALSLLQRLPNNSIDVCLTDPPYGIDYQSARRIDRSQWKPKIQNDKEPFIAWIKPLYDKMKGGGRLICFYRWDVQDAFLNEMKLAGFVIKSQLVWNKVIHGMGDLKGAFAPQHELMLYATKGRYEFKGKRPKTIYQVNRVSAEKLIHPNEKPIELMENLIKDISIEGDLVFDPFGGSFAVYKAALLNNRRALSCELDEEYFRKGEESVLQLKAIET